MDIDIFYKKKKRKISVVECGFFRKISGLMFRSKETENLLFPFSVDTRTPIHSYFVFFPFLAVWLDEKNNIIESKIVLPFTTVIIPKKEFRKLVELPLNNKNKAIIEFLVGKERFKYGDD